MTPQEIGGQYGLPGIVIFLLLANGGKYLVDWLKAREDRKSKEPTPERQRLNEIDANILTVARSKDELEVDNARIRQTLHEERVQHAADRAEWSAERAVLRAEAERLEGKLRKQAERAAEQYAALLKEFTELRIRHGI